MDAPISSTLLEAPGARAAKVCGIVAIVSALTCVGIPVALVLGIVALVKHGKASRAAKASPGQYQPVPATGLVTGILGLALPFLMLPFVGIASAIAVPALLGQRARARDLMLETQWRQVRSRTEAVALELWSGGRTRPVTGEEVIERLLGDPALAALKNTVDPRLPLLVRGVNPGPGAIALSPEREEDGKGSSWSVRIRGRFGFGDGAAFREEKVQVSFVDREVPQDAAEGWKAEAQPPRPN
jgi:hypothetical protein